MFTAQNRRRGPRAALADVEAPPPPEADASLQAAVENVFSSGQQFLVDRLDLMALDAKESVVTSLQRGALAGVAALFGLLSLVTLSVGLAMTLARYMPAHWAVLSTGGLHLALAAAAGGVAVARRQPSVLSGPARAVRDAAALADEVART